MSVAFNLSVAQNGAAQLEDDNDDHEEDLDYEEGDL